MATLEKPRKERSKKSKQKTTAREPAAAVDEEEEDVTVEEITATSQQMDHKQLDFDQLVQFEAKATATTNIISHDCIAGDRIDEPSGSTATSVSTASVTPTPTQYDVTIEEIPTAPPTESVGAPIFAISIPAPSIVHYPQLDSLHRVETISPVIYQAKPPSFCLAQSELRPFSAEQLKHIYHCAELDMVHQFELEFLMNSLLEPHESDPLYTALLDYYNLQSKLTINQHDVRKCRQEVADAQANIWIEVPITKQFKGRCGDAIELTETVTYNITQVDGKQLNTVAAAQNRLHELVCFTYTTNLIAAQITKVKIDRMVNVLINHEGGATIDVQTPVSLHSALNDAQLECMAALRRAISILFNFIRKLSPNKDFDADLKLWLRKAVSLHLRLATKEDHWFLLFNTLRCPSGVGAWAAPFLQVPGESMLSALDAPPHIAPFAIQSAEMNHCIAVLQILLLPIKKRQEYLKAFRQSQKEICDPVREERWILVDSDGEDSHTSAGDCVGLKESDLIALLNQIPFGMLFRSALGIEECLNEYTILVEDTTAPQMLRIVAFFYKLIELFGEGMLTYNAERYKQLAKRLGRLVRHTLQYVFDYHQLFSENGVAKDVGTCERIAVELNALLIKACSYIYRTRNLATWQYFSALPFSALDTETIWQIFYFLNMGFPTALPTPFEDYSQHINTKDFWQKFNVAHADSSAEDLYYLLQAFFEMANERDKVKDAPVIRTIGLHIFNIGYINEATRDVCYKTSRDMLVNLSLICEDLMSSLLLQLKMRFADTEYAAYLFKSLPLDMWRPGMDSFEILSNWLLHYDYQTQENMLARVIVSHLNWAFDAEGRLFLPHNIHVRMACLISEAINKHSPEVVGLSGISESVRQVSSLIDFTQATREQFSTWCWNMIAILRLHLMDQSAESIKRTLQRPTEPLSFVPELERIDLIYQAVTENRPLAIYVALLVSLHGHSIPLICQKGFELMRLLLTDYRHAAVIRCLELIVPLFLETPETLANCESFHGILNVLLNADRTYLKMAKDIIYPNSIGPVMELLDNMIHHQITNYTNYSQLSPLNLINVWLNCLTALPNWPNTNAVYLLDQILRVAYQFPDARLQALEYFRNYYQNCNEWKCSPKRSTLKSLFGSNVTRLPTATALHPWLALVLLELEFESQEAPRLWPEFLRQLAATTTGSKANVDAVLKKTIAVLKWNNSFGAPLLVVYKYANLLAQLDVRHPLVPIIGQKFFELFLARLPQHLDEQSFQNVYGVSDKFYEYNVPLMKKIKANIQAAKSYYTNQGPKVSDQEELSHLYRECAKLMKTYALWLEETSINRQDISVYAYPPQYNNEKLRELLSGNSSHWTEYLYLPAIRAQQREQAQQWAHSCCRSLAKRQQQTAPQTKNLPTPAQRIKQHLGSYDQRSSPPDYIRPMWLQQQRHITSDTSNKLSAHLKTLNSMANKFHYQTTQLNSLNVNYLEIVPQLYEMVPYNEIKLKSCASLVFQRKCCSPARITITLESKRLRNAVQRKLQSLHERYESLTDEILDAKALPFAIAIEEMESMVRAMLAAQTQSPTVPCPALITKTGTQFFYTLIDHMTDINMQFAPTNDFYTQCLNELALIIQENQESEGLHLLQCALKRPDLVKVLAGAFVPYRTEPKHFLQMYKFLIDSHLKRCDTKILFVLFSKFDLNAWLDNFQPKLFDINALLQMVLNGLESWSQPDSSLLQDQFRRHLVHIFAHDFPQHYGEVMQLVLDRISDQKLMPVVLLDLLNALLERFNCTAVDESTTSEQMTEIATDFGRRQNLFNLKAASDTVMLFARHFQKERLHHGLHGLYPKHSKYCQPLSLWFSCFGHVVVLGAICIYQALLADQISDVVFGIIIEMYAPWLVVYTEQTWQQSANWIRQLTDNGGNKTLKPWSEQHAATSKIMIRPFIATLNFVLESLPVSDVVLSHTFGWYVHHFATPPAVEQYIQAPIQDGISTLPWERFKPQSNYIDMLHSSLQKCIPAAHAMLGHIFIRIDWTAWIGEYLPTLPVNVQSLVVSRLLTIFVKIAFEPNIHGHINTSKILEDAVQYPWHLVDGAELEQLLKWFVGNVEPSIVLKIPGESNYADRAVLDLLRLACGMSPERGATHLMLNIIAAAKRLLYVRSLVSLLRSCAAKNQKLLASKDGVRVFKAAFIELLNHMDEALNAMAGEATLAERRGEAAKLMNEVLAPMQRQSEETSNLHIDALIEWQQEPSRAAANLLGLSILETLARQSAFITGSYKLLESSVAYYFRTAECAKDWHTPSWSALLQTLRPALDRLDLMPIMRFQQFFNLHILIIFKLEQLAQTGDKITFLQDLCQLVENLKTSEETEPRLAIVWGLIVARGCHLLAASEHVKKPLLMLARNLHVVSTQSEGWGDGLLGAIGLKRDLVTNRRKILTRSLACVIFALFPIAGYEGRPQPNEEFASSLRELTALLANKKFNDVKTLIVQAVSIVEEQKLPELRDVPHLICRLISLFYADEFLTTIPEVWDFDYQLCYASGGN